jgi:DNA-binding NarL/FixJ family response regulator
MNLLSAESKPAAILILIVIQALCAVFFVGDVISDARALGAAGLGNWHFSLEAAAALSLAAAIVFEVSYLLSLLRRKARLERSMSVASGALHELIEAYFVTWNLTPSEQDVAQFTIKGFSIAEIAKLRGSAQGTVKSHLNAIYRKAGVTGRSGLLALLIEDLLDAPLIRQASDAA